LQIKADGSAYVHPETGRQEAMTDDWLRFEVVPPDGRSGTTVPLTPLQEMQEYLDQFEQQLAVADGRLCDAEQVELPTRERAIDQHGIAISVADELSRRLTDLQDRVAEHKFTAKRIQRQIDLTDPDRAEAEVAEAELEA
jgi:Na+-transporting NADH:ubiquinone oxidoreductase subunit NqrC